MITIITAMTRNRVIGKRNALPWYIPEELKLFRKLTSGHTVIMGKNTFHSIEKPLPNRHNIVVSSSEENIEGVDVCRSISEALTKANGYQKEIYIIGGANIYAQFLPIVDRLYISYIKTDYEGDVFFPPFDVNQWNITEKKDFPEFEFVVCTRR